MKRTHEGLLLDRHHRKLVMSATTMPFHSLRFRLIALFVMIFGAIQMVLGIGGLFAREQHLRRMFDQQLLQRADGMLERLLEYPEPITRQTLAQVISSESKAIHFRDFYVQVRDQRGPLVARSHNLLGYQLPEGRRETNQRRKRLQTISGEEVERLAGRGQALRMVSIDIQSPGRDPLTLQVATSLQHVQESIAFLRLLFAIGIPVGLFAAAAASWVVTGHAMQRLAAVSNLADTLTADRLDRRLEPPQRHDEVGEVVQSVNAMLDRLEAGFNAQAQFIQDASHELKTPVSVLLSEAQVLKLTRPPVGEYRRFVDSVEEEMRRLGKLIEGLLTLTRSDGRSIVIRGQRLSVNEAVVGAIQQCAPAARQRGVRIALSLCEDEREPTIRGDRELVITMVSNVLRNAIRFTERGEAVEVTVRGRARAGLVDILVADRGPGIEPQALSRVFDRFVRGVTANGHTGRPDPLSARKESRHDGGGMGLGLAIARSVAELHGGEIHAQARHGGGTLFIAALPMERESGHTPERRRDDSVLAATSGHRRIRQQQARQVVEVAAEDGDRESSEQGGRSRPPTRAPAT